VESALLTNSRERVRVLAEDDDLADLVPPERRDDAEQVSVARVLRRDNGTWDARGDASVARDGLGLLIIDGMLVRRVGFGGHFGAELLGPGDILRPWEHDGEEAVLPFEATWRVLKPVRMAVLDRKWTARMCAYPELISALFGRSQRRSRRLASMLVISQQRRLEDTLWLFLWELADRYGVVRRDGVHVGLKLTHKLVGYLIGAQRPSVSTALKRMEDAGRIRRERSTWILLGDPPMPDEL
jgi:CRP-like cAMP-binding protein